MLGKIIKKYYGKPYFLICGEDGKEYFGLLEYCIGGAREYQKYCYKGNTVEFDDIEGETEPGRRPVPHKIKLAEVADQRTRKVPNREKIDKAREFMAETKEQETLEEKKQYSKEHRGFTIQVRKNNAWVKFRLDGEMLFFKTVAGCNRFIEKLRTIYPEHAFRYIRAWDKVIDGRKERT